MKPHGIIWAILLASVALWLFIFATRIFFLRTPVKLNVINKLEVVDSSKLNVIDNKTTDNIKISNVVIQRRKIKYHVPKFMLELYENNKVQNFDGPDVVRSLIPKHAGAINNQPATENHLIVFNLPHLGKDETFVSAELRILTINHRTLKDQHQANLRLSVYDEDLRNYALLEELNLARSNDSWLSFNVTRPVGRLLERTDGGKFLKFVVSLSNQPHLPSFKLSLMPKSEDMDHNYPILLLSYSTDAPSLINRTRKSVKRRSIEDDYEEASNRLWENEANQKTQLKRLKRIRNSCKRKPLYVDFSEIDYDVWIVQPTGYEAYQCLGRCFYPIADHLNPSKHAIVQALLHSVSPSKAPRSCCVPTQLGSISILYVDTNGVLTYRYAYRDMVVLECGCK